MAKNYDFSQVKQISKFKYLSNSGVYKLIHVIEYTPSGVIEKIEVTNYTTDHIVTNYLEMKEVVDAYYEYMNK